MVIFGCGIDIRRRREKEIDAEFLAPALFQFEPQNGHIRGKPKGGLMETIKIFVRGPTKLLEGG